MSSRRRFRLTLVRHGETELNRQGLIQGQGIDVHLNGTGRSQATALGKYLHNQKYDLVYSSDQSRAFETSELILFENTFHGKCKNDVPSYIRKDTRIRERCYGIMEGHTREDFDDLAKSHGESRLTFVPDGAESVSEIADRAESFFLDLCKQCFDLESGNKAGNDPPNVLVVSHGRLLATLMTRFSDKYGCVFPPGKLGVVPGNTAMSCFIIEFMKHTDPANIGHKSLAMHCSKLHFLDHLALDKQ